MGVDCAPYSNSGVVGRFLDAQASQLDFSGAACGYVAGNKYLHDCTLVLPDISGEKFIDLQQHFYAHRSWFFGANFASVVFSLLKTLVLYRHLPSRVDSAFEFTFGVAALVAAVTRSEWFHRLFAPAMGLLIVVYIALLFARL
jgi:hypothetical protein